MVGEAPRLRHVPTPMPAAARLLVGMVAGGAALASAQTYVVSGTCRDGEPNGAYELRMPDGRLRAIGAFAKGKRTGTFVFWAESGARIAVIPYEDNMKAGTVALWYAPVNAKADLPRKLEAVYVGDVLHGITRSWHANGNPRTELRYERGELVEARAWVEAGAPLRDVEARVIAGRDFAIDDRYYTTLEAIITGNRPRCE